MTENNKVVVKQPVMIGNRDPNVWHWAAAAKIWVRKADLYDNRKKPR